MSLPILSESVQLPKPLENREDAQAKMIARLEKEGFKFSLEDEQIKYQDFFNEASISTKNRGDAVEAIYEISITAKCIAAIVVTLLLALIPGVTLVTVWYLKYSRLKQSIETTLDSLS
ncbi:MAG: hypothetical protein JSW01_04260 [Candidatus Bathyarchaeota archaeon]|nr:MAG: hypothetical protein JSW01_04260 [Candidatus Bathyarchaeota archaeon]